jgi:hypothetical protein
VEQNNSRGHLNSGKKISGEFVLARGDGSKVFDLVEETLDEVAFAVERRIHGVLFGWPWAELVLDLTPELV